MADTLHIGSQNSPERKYLIFHKSAVISATRGDVPELKLSAGKIDLCGELYHNGQPLDLSGGKACIYPHSRGAWPPSDADRLGFTTTGRPVPRAAFTK